MIVFPEPIPLDEVNTYVKLAKQGNLAAQRELIWRNGRLIVSIASQLAKNYNRRFSTEELTQEGLAIVPTAIRTYDPNAGATFISYLTLWIRHAIGKFIKRNLYLVHVPENVSDSLRNSKSGRGRIRASKSDMDYLSSLDIHGNIVRDESGKFNDLWDMIPNKEPDSEFNSNGYGLTKLEDRVIDLVINNGYRYTEIAQSFNLSRERVRQISECALVKIKTINKINSKVTYLDTELLPPNMNNYRNKNALYEFYVESNGAITRKLLKRIKKSEGSPIHGLKNWMDLDGNEVDLVYEIPITHFTRNRMSHLYDKLIGKISKYGVKYKYYMESTSDKWILSFDSYTITYGLNGLDPAIKLSSCLDDIPILMYKFDDISKIFIDIDKILKKL